MAFIFKKSIQTYVAERQPNGVKMKKIGKSNMKIFICFGVLLILYFIAFFTTYHFAKDSLVLILTAVSVFVGFILCLFDRKI